MFLIAQKKYKQIYEMHEVVKVQQIFNRCSVILCYVHSLLNPATALVFLFLKWYMTKVFLLCCLCSRRNRCYYRFSSYLFVWQFVYVCIA